MKEKFIHYCWFGKKNKPKLVKKCIKSWSKFLPNFKIIEWNETNFNIDSSCPYVREAYRAKKWAFVSDYVRLYVLNKFGGLYLDVDVELLKSPEELSTPFLAFENAESIAPGLICYFEKDDHFCKTLLKQYESEHFLMNNGAFNDKTICLRANDYFRKRGILFNDTTQFIDGYYIYDSSYFCPKNGQTGKIDKEKYKKAYSIHHYMASWIPLGQKMRWKIRVLFKNIKRTN